MTDSDAYNVAEGTNLIEWMIDTWGDSSAMADGLAVTVMLNGKSIFESDNDNASESLIDIELGETDSVVIINRPSGIELVISAIAIVVAVAFSLALAPALPGDAGEVSESPNNRLQAAGNSFRPGEARPQIFGSVVSYPDFVQPTYFEYVNNLKIVSELCYIGDGEFEVGEVRNGETPFNNIPGSSFTIYEPSDTIPTGLTSIHRTADPVDGQVLLAPDDESIRQDGQVASVSGGGASNLELTLNNDSTLVEDMALQISDYITISFADPITTPAFTAQVLNLQEISNSSVITLDTTQSITDPVGAINITKTDSSGEIGNYVGYFNIPGDDALEIWFNWQAPQGIRTEDGGHLEIDVEFEIEILNSDGTPSGTTFTKTESISGSTLDPQFRTTKFTLTEFPTMTRSQYRARVRRTSNQASGAASQQIKMEQFVSVTPYENINNSLGTMIAFERRATTFAVSSSGNKNNLDVTRKLPSYNRRSGTYDLNNLVATRSFSDAAAYTIIVGAGRSASSVDLAELYGIFDGLSSPDLGNFDFTFDNKNVAMGERVESICNVARVKPFRDGAIWRFTRDEAKVVRSAMFNRRVTVGNSSVQSWLLQRPDDKDSISLTYVDPVLNVERIIHRRVNDAGEIVSGSPGRQPLEIKLAGCRNLAQANNRADLEMRRIIYQRRTVTDVTRRDGMTVGLLERVGWVDPNDINVFSGEILGISGNVYDTSERFEPVEGESYIVYVTDDEGSPSNTVAITPRSDTEFGFVASGISGAYTATGIQQLGSTYFIGTASDITASDFLMTKREPQPDGSVNIELTEYVPQMYEMDS